MKNALKRSAVWKIQKAKQASAAVKEAHAHYVEVTPPDVRIKRIEKAYWWIVILGVLGLS